MSAFLDTHGEPTEALLRAVREELSRDGSEGDVAERVTRAVVGIAPVRGAAELQRVAQRVRHQLVGLGPLQDLAEGPGVSDVLVLADGSVWVEDAAGLRRTELSLPEEGTRRDLAVRLLGLGGRRLDDAMPFGDAVVGRFRVHAAIPPVSRDGTVLSVRALTRTGATLEALFPGREDPWRAWLEHAVRSRLNLLVSGGTGAGKTTLVSALLAASAPDERIVVVEDAPELAPRHPHVVSLSARGTNAEGRGEVTLAELVRQALRMRPDRLVVGECRGEEVREMLMALNTGHDGAAGTLHANGSGEVPARLTALGALAGWSERTTALQASAAVDIVVHVSRGPHGRRPTDISRLVERRGRLTAEAVVSTGEDGTPRPGPAFAWFASRARGAS